MKRIKIIYWIATGLFALMMIFSAYSYLTQATMQQGFQHLGLPNWFRVELAVAKFIGAVVVLAPVATRIKEWAYAGFAITLVSAFVAHTAVGDPVSAKVGPLVAMALLTISYLTYHQGQKISGPRPQPEVSRV